MMTLAPQWFDDAMREATSGSDLNSRRREIVFSTCFLESYIFEWVRDYIGAKELKRYFGEWRNLKKKWKEVPKELCRDGKIKMERQLDLSKLGKSYEVRNDLVHSAVNWPSSLGVEQAEKAPREGFRELKPGWALDTAVELVEKLHSELGTEPPEYVLRWKKRNLV